MGFGQFERENGVRLITLSYKYYAGPEGGVAGSEAHEYTMRAGVFETGAVAAC